MNINIVECWNVFSNFDGKKSSPIDYVRDNMRFAWESYNFYMPQSQ